MMAKLYWRVKLNGKWTWTPATYHEHGKNYQLVINYQEEEE